MSTEIINPVIQGMGRVHRRISAENYQISVSKGLWESRGLLIFPDPYAPADTPYTIMMKGDNVPLMMGDLYHLSREQVMKRVGTAEAREETANHLDAYIDGLYDVKRENPLYFMTKVVSKHILATGVVYIRN